MINSVKVLSFLIIVSSIIVISIRVCETTKKDFKFKNIFRLFDEKRDNRKSKKDIKHLKDFKVHYLEGKYRTHLNNQPIFPPLIHTLIPLPLQVSSSIVYC